MAMKIEEKSRTGIFWASYATGLPMIYIPIVNVVCTSTVTSEQLQYTQQSA
jgi:hypothetical protein